MEQVGKPPPYNPAMMPPSSAEQAQMQQHFQNLQQQQAYWAQQVPTGYQQPPPPQPQPAAVLYPQVPQQTTQTVLLVPGATTTTYGTHLPQPHYHQHPQAIYAATGVLIGHQHCFRERIVTGTGVARAILFVFTVAHLGLVADMMTQCRNSAYYIPLLMLPIATILHSFAALCMKRCKYRRRTCSGVGDIFSAILYVGQAAAILSLYYDVWQKWYSHSPDYWCFVGRDEMGAAAATAFIISLVHFIIGVSVCCCRCLTDVPDYNDYNYPPHVQPATVVATGAPVTYAVIG